MLVILLCRVRGVGPRLCRVGTCRTWWMGGGGWCPEMVPHKTAKSGVSRPLLTTGSKYESSRYDIYGRTSSGLSKNRSRFPNRPSWAELRRAQSCRFSSFSTEIRGTHYGRTIHVGNLPDHKCVYLDWNCALGWVKKNSDNPGRQK